MSNQVEQQTIRVNAKQNNHIKDLASQIGCSYNSLINILLYKGLEVFEAKPTLKINME